MQILLAESLAEIFNTLTYHIFLNQYERGFDDNSRKNDIYTARIMKVLVMETFPQVSPWEGTASMALLLLTEGLAKLLEQKKQYLLNIAWISSQTILPLNLAWKFQCGVGVTVSLTQT